MNHIQMSFLAAAYPATLEAAVEAASELPLSNPMEAAWAAASISPIAEGRVVRAPRRPVVRAARAVRKFVAPRFAAAALLAAAVSLLGLTALLPATLSAVAAVAAMAIGTPSWVALATTK
jgi:hypothetical protein